jgi:hypothetical protein
MIRFPLAVSSLLVLAGCHQPVVFHQDIVLSVQRIDGQSLACTGVTIAVPPTARPSVSADSSSVLLARFQPDDRLAGRAAVTEGGTAEVRMKFIRCVTYFPWFWELHAGWVCKHESLRGWDCNVAVHVDCVTQEVLPLELSPGAEVRGDVYIVKTVAVRRIRQGPGDGALSSGRWCPPPVAEEQDGVSEVTPIDEGGAP